jgi:hypothetical protein
MDRIVVSRTDFEHGVCTFDWVYMVRDADGLVLAFGVESGYSGGETCVRHAISYFELLCKEYERVPDFTIAQPPGDEALCLEKLKNELLQKSWAEFDARRQPI